MKKIEERFLEIRKFCEKNANPEIVSKYSCGRVIVQYAAEKTDKENRERFRRVKNKGDQS